MRKLIVLAFLISSFSASAQVNWEGILEQNSARNFLATVFNNGNDMNACVEINGTSHHLLAAAITKDANGIVDYMLDNADIDYTMICNDWTILQYGIKYGDAELVMRLLEKGADPAQKSHSGKSAMDFAKESGKPQVRAYLKSLQR